MSGLSGLGALTGVTQGGGLSGGTQDQEKVNPLGLNMTMAGFDK